MLAPVRNSGVSVLDPELTVVRGLETAMLVSVLPCFQPQIPTLVGIGKAGKTVMSMTRRSLLEPLRVKQGLRCVCLSIIQDRRCGWRRRVRQ